MKILNPDENINSIVKLVENAEKYIVMVSPFTNLKGWDNLRNALLNAPVRDVPVSYYVRGGEGRKGLEDMDLSVYEVPMLHSKMFFSEKEAIITSFHLLYNEDINWAWTMDHPDEYNELVKFFESSIKPYAIICNDPH